MHEPGMDPQTAHMRQCHRDVREQNECREDGDRMAHLLRKARGFQVRMHVLTCFCRIRHMHTDQLALR